MTERKYAMTKLAPGDWLLPDNDGKRLWRIARYEDGPSHGLEDWPKDREVWGIWRWLEPRHGTIDPDDWAEWEMWEGSCQTRQDAIEAALR